MINVILKEPKKLPSLKVSEIPPGQTFRANWFKSDGPRHLFVNARVYVGAGQEPIKTTLSFNNGDGWLQFGGSQPIDAQHSDPYFYNVELVDIEVKEL